MIGLFSGKVLLSVAGISGCFSLEMGAKDFFPSLAGTDSLLI